MAGERRLRRNVGIYGWVVFVVVHLCCPYLTQSHNSCPPNPSKAESLIDSYEILIANSTAGESLPCREILNQMRRRRDTTAPTATMPMLRRANVEGSGTDVIVIAEKVAVPLLFGWLGSFPIWK
jgi:hypothetical protein